MNYRESEGIKGNLFSFKAMKAVKLQNWLSSKTAKTG